ncbi:MAG: hypothetical protein GY711_29825 [bacterium]|nr:hypothetical protein [bacterium]
MHITITPKRLTTVFALAVLCVLLAHGVIQTVRFTTGDPRVFGLVAFLSVGADTNIPTFYSAFAILFCAVLLAAIGLAARKDERTASAYWFGLAAIFVFMSMDEMLMLHEHLSEPLRSAFDLPGYLYYAWVIPYVIGIAVFLAVYVRFLTSLPRRTAVLFVIAGATFVAGAVGFEMIGGHLYQDKGSDNIAYVAVQTVEEALEMAGIVIFIHALGDYIAVHFGQLGLHIGAAADATTDS